MSKRSWKYLPVGVVVTLVASLVFTLIPASVAINQSSFLAVGSSIVLAADSSPNSGVNETCSEYFARRLKEGWKVIEQDGYNVTLLSPDGIRRELDLRNDVETLRPNAPGDLTELEPDPFVPNWQNVDETPPDEGATIVYEWDGDHGTDLYNLPAHSEGSGTINKITVFFRCYCWEWEARAQAAIKTNGILDYGSTEFLIDSWITYSQEWAQNPVNAHAWTWDEIDALQIGVLLDSVTRIEEANCTQVYVEVDYTAAGADISNLPSSKAFGIVECGSSNWSSGSEPSWPLDDGECYFTVTNNGDPCSITIEATNFTGTGTDWTLGVPAANVARLKAGKSGDANEEAMVTLTNSPQAFIAGLVTTKKWEVKLDMPTSADKYQKTSTITLVATLD